MGLIDEAGGKGFDKQYTVVKMPAEKTGTSFVGGGELAVFKKSKNRETAWKFVEYLSKPEVQAKFYELVTDLPPTRRPGTCPQLAKDPRVKVFGEQLEDAKTAPVFPKWEQFATKLNAELDETFTADRPPPRRSRGSRRPRSRPARNERRQGSIRRGRGRSRPRLRAALTGWGFSAPFVVLFAVFLLVPILASLVLAFTSFGIGNIQCLGHAECVGLENFSELFRDELFSSRCATRRTSSWSACR